MLSFKGFGCVLLFFEDFASEGFAGSLPSDFPEKLSQNSGKQVRLYESVYVRQSIGSPFTATL